jgi:flagellar hook-associated protein 3 FlgL
MNFGKRGIQEREDLLDSKTGKRVRKIALGVVEMAMIAIIGVCVAGGFLAYGAFRGIIDSSPDIGTIDVSPKGFSSFIYDADGNEINYDINYSIASRQTLAVNLEASDVFDSALYQDIQDMMNAVSSSINAHDKLTSVKAMKDESEYASTEAQENLTKWEAAVQKEVDYYDDNMQKLFSTFLGKASDYLSDISLAQTKVGCKGDQLALTKDRMDNQQETVQELQSTNDDLDLSDIVLKYTAAYTAYQSSLQAAGKLGSVSLLNYI